MPVARLWRGRGWRMLSLLASVVSGWPRFASSVCGSSAVRQGPSAGTAMQFGLTRRAFFTAGCVQRFARGGQQSAPNCEAVIYDMPVARWHARLRRVPVGCLGRRASGCGATRSRDVNAVERVC